MSALGSLVVKLALDHAEYTQGIDRTSQEALKFAKNVQGNFDQAGESTKQFLSNVATGAAGAIASVVGLNAAFTKINDSILSLDRLDEAAQKTGSSIQDLSRIQQVAKSFGDAFDPIEQGITRLAKGLAEFKDPTNDAIRALNAIGVSAKDSNGQLRTAGDVYIDVAKSLQQYRDGAEKTAVATALFGKNGAELLPMLNNLASGIDHVKGVSEKHTQIAAEYNDRVAQSKAAVNSFYKAIAIELLPSLNNTLKAVNEAGSGFGGFSGVVSSVAVPVLKGLAIAAFTVVDTFRGMGREIGARAAQLAALASLDFKGAKFIGAALAEDNEKSRAAYDKFVDAVLNGEKKLAQGVESGGTKKLIDFSLNGMPAATAAGISASQKFIEQLQMEADQLGKTSAEIRKMQAAKLGVSAVADPLIDKIEQETKAAKQLQDDMSRVKQITDSVANSQEIYNQKLAELERLKPQLGVETYERALKKLRDETFKTVPATKQATSEVDQLWVQAGRNIQSTLANSIFNFFDDGLKGMVKNVVTAVGRIASEFAALRLSQAIGLGSLFSVSGAASAAGAAGGGLNLMNLAGAGSSVASLFKGGLGSLGLASSLGSGLPGSAGSFFAGLSGVGSAGASSGIFSAAGGAGTAFIGGPGTAIGGAGMGGAATMGASFAAFAGPAIALAAVDAIGRLFGGNKTLGGAEMIPVIGGFLAGLFGHGPMKFRQQSLQGTVSGSGFDGDITNVFRAKGGLLVGNKHDPRQQDIPHQLQDMLDTTIDGFYKSAHGFAENLGLDVNLVDHFTQELQIKSEKGKKLTDEAIQQMLAGIGDSVARNLIPAIDTLQKAGETQFQTLTRLNDQFNALAHGAENLGASVDFARQLVSNLTFEQRDSFIKMSGGIEALNSKTQFFAQNFLTDAERLTPVSERLHSEMSKLGFSADITKDQFKALVQSLSTTDEVRNALLDLAPAFLAVKNATEQVTQAVDNSGLKAALGSAFTDLQKSADAQRKSATQKYNDAVKESDKRIQEVTTSIGKLKTLSDSLKSSVEKLRPLSREDAKFQLLGAINGAKRGIFPEQGSLDRALGVLTDSNSITGARSSFEFAREQAKTANMIADLGDLTDDQLTVEQRSLAQLERQRKALDQGFADEMTRLDSLVDSAQKQIDSLNGINTAILTLSKAIGEFNRASTQAGGGVIGGGNISGNPNVSDQQIRDFVNIPGVTDMDIYNAAKKNGVSFEQYARARGIDVNALYKWADAHGLPRFADGGFHSGGLRIVGERGPELEFTGPSRIASNNDLREALSGNKEVVIELRLLRAAVEKNNRYSRGVFKDISAVTQGGTSFRTTAA